MKKLIAICCSFLVTAVLFTGCHIRSSSPNTPSTTTTTTQSPVKITTTSSTVNNLDNSSTTLVTVAESDFKETNKQTTPNTTFTQTTIHVPKTTKHVRETTTVVSVPTTIPTTKRPTTTVKNTTTNPPTTPIKSNTKLPQYTPNLRLMELLDAINAYRRENGLNTLSIDYDYCRLAYVRAKEQTTQQGHTRPDGSSFGTVFKEYSVQRGTRAEEDIAHAPPDFTTNEVLHSWQNSAKHNASLLSSRMTTVGIAMCNDGNGTTHIVLLMTN